MSCQNCGAELSVKARLCPKCNANGNQNSQSHQRQSRTSPTPKAWLDRPNAWRQSQDAVIYPIVYDETELSDKQEDVQVIVPIPLPDVTSLLPPPLPEPTAPPFLETAFETSDQQRHKPLSIAVPLLLVATILLFVVAYWLKLS